LIFLRNETSGFHVHQISSYQGFVTLGASYLFFGVSLIRRQNPEKGLWAYFSLVNMGFTKLIEPLILSGAANHHPLAMVITIAKGNPVNGPDPLVRLSQNFPN
jgi:uncharacterized membrane protein